MKIQCPSIYNTTMSVVTDNALPSLTAQQKKIAIVVAVVFALLAAICFAVRCFSASKPAIKKDESIDGKKDKETTPQKEVEQEEELEEQLDTNEDLEETTLPEGEGGRLSNTASRLSRNPDADESDDWGVKAQDIQNILQDSIKTVPTKHLPNITTDAEGNIEWKDDAKKMEKPLQETLTQELAARRISSNYDSDEEDEEANDKEWDDI